MRGSKRPRLRHVDLETISKALEFYSNDLKEQLAKHEEDETRFKDLDKWLQKREELNWLFTNAKHARGKIAANLEGAQGRTPELLKQLLHVTAEDNPGEYVRLLKAVDLLPPRGLEEDINTLLNAIKSGAIYGFRDRDDDGMLKVRKLDVLRLAAFLEVHK